MKYKGEELYARDVSSLLCRRKLDGSNYVWLSICKGSLKYPEYVLFLLLLIRITYFLFTYSMKEAGLGHKQWRGGPISSNCKQCPVVYTNPVCGSDGHTYSSQVRTA